MRRACLWILPYCIGVVFVPFPKGIEASKRSHIIEALLEEMRKGQGQTSQPPTHEPDEKTGNSDLKAFSTNELYPDSLLQDSRSNILREISSKHSDIPMELPEAVEGKRFTPILYEVDKPMFRRSGLQRYIIKKVKRQPEHFPSDMYTVQGGKQQLEVDLDNELNRIEHEFNEHDRKNNINGDDLSENENGIPVPGNNNELINEEIIHHDKEDEINGNVQDDVLSESNNPRQAPADIIISGADLPEYGHQAEIVDPIDEKDMANQRRKRVHWAASSLYRLRIPKSPSRRRHRTRTVLPHLDPILYFIGLGK